MIKTHVLVHSKKTLCVGLIVCMVLFLISFTSAFEFDNVYTYNENTKTATIKNAFGFGADIATVQLITPLNVVVPRGYQKVAEFKLTGLQDYSDSLKELELYNKKDNLKKFNRNYDYKYKTYEDVLVNDYDNVFKGYTENGTKIYSYEIVGNHYEEKEVWNKLNIVDIKNNDVLIIGIFTNVEAGDNVEWIPNMFGIRIEEWASWTENLAVGLLGNWELDEGDITGTGTIVDKLGLNDGTNAGAINAVGLLGGAYDFEDDIDSTIGIPTTNGLDSLDNWSISYWIKAETIPQFPRPFHFGNNTDTQGIAFEYNIVPNPDEVQMFVGTGAGHSTLTGCPVDPGRWIHIVGTYDGTSARYYCNGTLVDTEGLSYTTTTADITLGARPDLNGSAGRNFDGIIDSLKIWDRPLNTTEISELYNGGAGITSNNDVYFTYDNVNYSTYCTTETLPTLNYPISTLDYSGVGGSLQINYTCDSTNYLYNITLTTAKNITFFNSTSQQLYSWNYKLLQTAEYFAESTTSGATNPFNITLDSDSQITIAYLNYNNTAVLGSISYSGDTYVLSRNQISPVVSSDTNISFYWNITRADGFNYAITSQNQTVSPIVINETCTGMYRLYNLSLVDEITQVKINEASHNSSIKVDLNLYDSGRTRIVKHYYAEFKQTNPVTFCIDNNLSSGEKYSLDLQIQYAATNYSTEIYNIYNFNLNSSSLNQNITLYDLPTANAQNFKLLVRDTSYLPIEGALIEIQRKYIENGTFLITEIPKTDAEGLTSASLQLNDVIYKFNIYDAGVLVSSFDNVLAICQTPLVSTCIIDFNAILTGIDIPNYEDNNGFNFTLGYNSTTKTVTSTFLISSGEPSTILLEVIREDSLGTAVCQDTLISASGTLSCVIPVSFGNSTVLAKVYRNGIEQGRGNIKLDQKSSDIFGPILVILSLFVMLTLVGIGISDNPIISGVFLFVGVLLLFAMNLVSNSGFIGATSTFLFLGIAIILIIIKAGRRT